MSTVIDMLGINKKIEQAVNKRLQDSFITPAVIKKEIKFHVDVLAADVYSNMKSIEEQKYKQVELDIQVGNLAALVKILQERGDK